MIEQWHTVEEAEKLWCPMMPQREIVGRIQKQNELTVEMLRVEQEWRVPQIAVCIGPRCMAWIDEAGRFDNMTNTETGQKIDRKLMGKMGRCGMVRG